MMDGIQARKFIAALQPPLFLLSSLDHRLHNIAGISISNCLGSFVHLAALGACRIPGDTGSPWTSKELPILQCGLRATSLSPHGSLSRWTRRMQAVLLEVPRCTPRPSRYPRAGGSTSSALARTAAGLALEMLRRVELPKFLWRCNVAERGSQWWIRWAMRTTYSCLKVSRAPCA